MSGYRRGPWPCEDGGPARQQVPGPGHRGLAVTGPLQVTSRLAPVLTMAVTRDPGEVYVLRHPVGDRADCSVERVDPITLEPLAVSDKLAGGPTWPGSIGAHANGSLYVVFGNHAHRLDPGLTTVASASLPRDRPYNGFVVMADGTLVTKDFAGSRPGLAVPAELREPCQLVALEPEGLRSVATCTMDEPSIARLSGDGETLYVVGDTSLLRARWDGSRIWPDPDFRVPYRTLTGQTYGWDCVLAAGAAWFLDDGEGSESYDGTLLGHGVSTAPLHLVRVDLDTGRLTRVEICGRPGGLVANPPVIDVERQVAVGYDSGNGVMAAFSLGPQGHLEPRWRRDQNHGSHMVLCPGSGQLVSGHYDAHRGIDEVVGARGGRR